MMVVRYLEELSLRLECYSKVSTLELGRGELWVRRWVPMTADFSPRSGPQLGFFWPQSLQKLERT